MWYQLIACMETNPFYVQAGLKSQPTTRNQEGGKFVALKSWSRIVGQVNPYPRTLGKAGTPALEPAAAACFAGPWWAGS
jgi:hypothetical protein